MGFATHINRERLSKKKSSLHSCCRHHGFALTRLPLTCLIQISVSVRCCLRNKSPALQIAFASSAVLSMHATQKSQPPCFKVCSGSAAAVQPDYKIRPARSVKPKYLHSPVLRSKNWKTCQGNTGTIGKCHLPQKHDWPRIIASL